MALELPDAITVLSGLPEITDREPGRLTYIRVHRDILLPVTILMIIGLMCFVYPFLYPLRSSTNGILQHSLLSPFSPHYLLGTDPLGIDVVSRILYGGRISIEVGVGATAIGLFVGGTLGVIAGYMGGLVGGVIMRLLDVLLAFPSLVLAMVMANYLGPSELHVIYAIALFSIPAFARLSRAETLRLRDQTFVVASKLSGASDRRIVIRHIAPNVIQRLITYAFLVVAIAVIVEAALSFLGLGVPNPKPSWGNMIALGEQYLAIDPYLVLIPSACLFLTVVSLSTLGDALRARLGRF